MTSLNILVLTDEIYPDAIGGIGKSVYNEVMALSRRGHHVTVVVRSLKRQLLSETIIDRVRIVRFNGPERQNRLYRLYPLAILRQVSGWLRKHAHDYDVLYVHNPLYLLAVQWGSLRLPVAYRFHASMAHEIRFNAQRGKYGHAKRPALMAAQGIAALERAVFRRADTMLPTSTYTCETLHHIYRQAPVFEARIGLGVDPDAYAVTAKLEARQWLGLPDTRPIFITVRRLEGRMGLHNLIDAVAQVRDHHPDVLLLIGGKGYLRDELEKQINDQNLTQHVRLLGFVPEGDLPLYLAAADAFVLPTEILEGFGLATIEAMSVGTPVIGTPVGATPEILRPLDDALLTRDVSAVAIAETLVRWLDRRDDLRALAIRSRQQVEQRYHADLVAEQLETAFRQVIGYN